MAGESQNKIRGSNNLGRSGQEKYRRGKGNFNKNENRGSRTVHVNDSRSSNRRVTDGSSVGFVSRANPVSYTSQNQYYVREAVEPYGHNAHVPKFDGNTLSDLNEFPDFNHCESSGVSRNSKNLDDRNFKPGEVKSLNWNGRDQLVTAPRVVDQVHVDTRTQGRIYPNDTNRYDNRVFDNSHSRNDRGANTSTGFAKNVGRQFQRRSNGSPKKFAQLQQNQPQTNPQPNNYDDSRYPVTPVEFISLYNNCRFVSPPTLEGHECMPGDSIEDHDESNFYKVKVNDDTLDLTMRIIYQLEFYFSNFNLKTDSFLRDKMDFNGYVSFETIMKFPRMMRLKASRAELIEAVNKSEKLECDATGEMLRRNESPKRWTNGGLLSEVLRIYNSYIYDDNFSAWYTKAQEFLKSFTIENQKPGQYNENPFGLPFMPFVIDPKTGAMMPSYLFSYPEWSNVEYMNSQEMEMAVAYPVLPFGMEVADMNNPQVLMKPAISSDPVACEKFKEIITSRAVSGTETAAPAVINSEQSTVTVESQDHNSEQQQVVAESPERILQLESENLLPNPKELRNFRLSSKPKGQPVKHDRHSAMQYKNIKVEAQRDIEKQVEMGLDSYEHEQHKRSTSVHGALSQNPEAPSKVFVSDVPKNFDQPKPVKPSLPTIVDGTRIVTDKKVIQEACDMFSKGVQEPIPIVKPERTIPSQNGFKDASKNKDVRKDNQKSGGLKPKKGPKPKGPSK